VRFPVKRAANCAKWAVNSAKADANLVATHVKTAKCAKAAKSAVKSPVKAACHAKTVKPVVKLAANQHAKQSAKQLAKLWRNAIPATTAKTATTVNHFAMTTKSAICANQAATTVKHAT